MVVALLATGWLALVSLDGGVSAARRLAAMHQLTTCTTQAEQVWSDERPTSSDTTRDRVQALRMVALACADLDRAVLGEDLTTLADVTAESAARAASCMSGKTFAGLACAPQALAYAAFATGLVRFMDAVRSTIESVKAVVPGR